MIALADTNKPIKQDSNYFIWPQPLKNWKLRTQNYFKYEDDWLLNPSSHGGGAIVARTPKKCDLLKILFG